LANRLRLTQAQEVELTRICCDTAKEANPEATTIVNVCLPFGENAAYGATLYAAVDYDVYTPLTYLDALMSAGVEFDVIGIQLYFPTRDLLSISNMLDEFARFGKPLHVTELGVRSAGQDLLPDNPSQLQLMYSQGTWHSPWSEKIQADWMEWFYTLAYAREDVYAITWWDFQDPSFLPTGGFLDEQEIPKEILFRLKVLRTSLL